MSIWLITGCSSGLGKGIAQAALKRGEKAAITARNTEALKELEEQYPAQVLALKMDLNDKESMRLAVEKTRKEQLVNHHDQAGDPKKEVKAGKKIFYDIYTEAEKKRDPDKRDTGLFFFRGKPGGSLWAHKRRGRILLCGIYP